MLSCNHILLSKIYGKSAKMPAFYSALERIGGHLTREEVKLLLFLTGNTLSDVVKQKIHDGEDLLLALVSTGVWTDDDFPKLLELLRRIGRYDLLHMLHINEEPRAIYDTYVSNSEDTNIHSGGKAHEIPKIQNSENKRRSKNSRKSNSETSSDEPSSKRLRPTEQLNTEMGDGQDSHSENLTCDVQLRVRVECNKLESVLEGAVLSNKNDPIERSLELFTQASTVLMSRDLGYIVCNIKFSELSYLDAFWRDYLNGSLQEALKV